MDTRGEGRRQASSPGRHSARHSVRLSGCRAGNQLGIGALSGQNWAIGLIEFIPDCVPGDLDGDGVFDEDDVRAGMNQFGIQEASQCEGDINGDGVVDAIDLSYVLSRWGICE